MLPCHRRYAATKRRKSSAETCNSAAGHQGASKSLTMSSYSAATCHTAAASPNNRLSRLSRSAISTVWLTLSIMGMVSCGNHGNGRGVQLCSEVQSRCFGRDGCKFALENYFLHCMDLSDNPSYECTNGCKMALIMLLSSEEHDGPNAFRECDCQGEEFCLQQKERIATCQDDVQLWLDAISDPVAQITCSLATLVCSADSTCLMAINYYEDHCKRLQDPSNPRCTSRCNNSLNILYRQDKAQKLRNCYCDGQESYNCSALKQNTHHLCFGEGTTPRVRHPPSHDHTRHPHPHPTPPLVDYNLGIEPSNYDDTQDTSVDNSIEQDFQALGSSHHNSAYTIHSDAGWSRCSYKQSLNLILTLIVLLYTLSNR